MPVDVILGVRVRRSQIEPALDIGGNSLAVDTRGYGDTQALRRILLIRRVGGGGVHVVECGLVEQSGAEGVRAGRRVVLVLNFPGPGDKGLNVAVGEKLVV